MYFLFYYDSQISGGSIQKGCVTEKQTALMGLLNHTSGGITNEYKSHTIGGVLCKKYGWQLTSFTSHA